MTNDPRDPGDPQDPSEFGANAGQPGELPEEIARVLRELTGGADLPPQMVEQLKAMGIADADPQALSAMAGQMRAMFAPGAPTHGVDLSAATTTATTVASEGDVEVGEREQGLAQQAAHLAGMWLDQATSLEAPGLVGRAITRRDWVEATMPVWAELVEPVADGLSEAISGSLTSRLGEQGTPRPEDLEAMGLPAGFDVSMLAQQVAPMVGRLASSLITVQLGQAVGTLSSEVLTATEVGVPLVRSEVALMPTSIAAFADGLDVEIDEVWLHLAVREAARMRLFIAVPWLGPQILTSIQEYARGMEIDTDAIDSAVQQIDPSDPQALTEALGSGLFDPQPSAAQRAALSRLETWLALIEGWVDVVAARATAPHLPHTDAMGETIRRRRATGGPAEKTFAGLVGLELRPRRLRDAANLFAALEDRLGAEGRDAAWGHPDVAPGAADLDDVLGYVERAADASTSEGSDDLDAELAKLLDAEAGPSDGDGAPPREGGPST